MGFGLDLEVLTGASTRGMPNRAARCLRFSSSGSTVVVGVITGGETTGAGMVVAGAGGVGVGFKAVGFGAGWSVLQSILGYNLSGNKI